MVRKEVTRALMKERRHFFRRGRMGIRQLVTHEDLRWEDESTGKKAVEGY